MRAASILRRVVARWQHRVAEPRSSERGDTLVEVLLAMVILGIAGVALLAGFATSIAASAEHRNLASLDSSTRIAANEAIADVQQQAQATRVSRTTRSRAPALRSRPSFSNLTGVQRGLHRGATGTGRAGVPRWALHPVRAAAVHAHGDLGVVEQLQHLRDHRHLRPVVTAVTQRRRLAVAAPMARAARRRHGGHPDHAAARGGGRGLVGQHRPERLLLGHVAGPPATRSLLEHLLRRGVIWDRPVLGLQPECGRDILRLRRSTRTRTSRPHRASRSPSAPPRRPSWS